MTTTDREALALLILGRTAPKAADAIIAAGWTRADPNAAHPLTTIVKWFQELPLAARRGLSLANLHDLSKRLGTGAMTVTPEQAAYGALWRMMSANPFLKNARACLLTAIGGEHSEGHREAIAWAVATFDPVSDAEISRLEL